MIQLRWMAVAVIGLLGAFCVRAEEKVVPGKIESVTLYRGQALVTRAVPVDGAGSVEIVVAGLPEQVQPDSLFAEGAEGIEVRAVRFRTRAVGEEPREEVRKIEADMEATQDKLNRNRRMQAVVAQRTTYLDKMENFVAPTATTELSKGVLNAETIKGIAAFSYEQRKAVAEEAQLLDIAARDLEKQLQFLAKRRAELTKGSSKQAREAVLFIDKKIPAPGMIRLSYLAGGAGWSPAYNIRAEKDAKDVRVEYNAQLHQMSGEDWTGIALTLSTASPALSAEVPGLAPFRVALSRQAQQNRKDQAEATNSYNTVQSRKGQALEFQQSLGNRNGAPPGFQRFIGAGVQLDLPQQQGNVVVNPNWALNALANEEQGFELQLDNESIQYARKQSFGGDGPSVSYKLEGLVSVASRSDQQLIRISENKLPSTFYYVASPVLTSYVFREAELINTAADALLTGPMNVYVDGRFVGRGQVPSVASGQTFVVGFGSDSQLRARRELADKSDEVQGGNRELKLKYRLVLENYKDAPVTVRVFDRIPVAKNNTDIRVTFDTVQDKLSEDALYLRLERPKGILRWEVEVAAKAAGDKARFVNYGYKVEFDRNMSLANSESNSTELMQEFEELQEKRLKY